MKKFLLIVAVAFASATYAQTEKGNWMVGSDLALSFESQKTTVRNDGTKVGDETVSTFKIVPNLNYFVIDNLAVGLGLGYESKKTKDVDGADNTFTIAPTAHYYFPIGGKLAPFVGAKVGYAHKSEKGSTKDANKWNGLVVGGKAGIAYFVNNGAALTGYVGYDHYSLKNKQENKLKAQQGTFGVGIGVALFF